MKRMWSRNEVKGQVQSALSSGDMKNVKVFEDVVDKNGHQRFIEGNITPEEITGFTYTYAKWSLSGTHLIIVIAGYMPSGTDIPVWQTLLANVILPKWIIDKIFPTTTSYLLSSDFKYAPMASSGSSPTSRPITATLDKPNNTLKLYFDGTGTPSVSFDSGFRLAIDLLIDNE